MIRRAVVAAIFALASGQTAGWELAAWSQTSWGTREGLPHNLVADLVQTPDGYLWMATWEGIARFNGSEFAQFHRGNVPELDNDGFRELAVASDGTLWAGTSAGSVLRLQNGRWQIIDSGARAGAGVGHAQVTSLTAGDDGEVWVGYERGGLRHYSSQLGWTDFGRAQGIPDSGVHDLLLDPSGRLWVASESGLLWRDPNQPQRFHRAPEVDQPIIALAWDAQQQRLLLGGERGVRAWQDARLQPIAADLPDDLIASLLAEADGTLWVGTTSRGLYRVQQGRSDAFGVADGLPNNRVATLLRDREGSLWAGTNGGLLRLREGAVVSIGSRSGLRDDYVRVLLASADGGLVAGTSAGPSRIDGSGKVLPAAFEHPWLDMSVLSLAAGEAGAVWVGTYADGVYELLEQGVGRHLDAAAGLPSNQVRALLQTAPGELWIGTQRGLARWRAGSVQVYLPEHGLPREFVTSLHQRPNGELWVATVGGAAVFRDGRFHDLELRQHNGAEVIFGFQEAADGALWIASDRGVLRLRDGAWLAIGRAQGLPFDKIFDLKLDRHGNLWLSSNRGILRLQADSIEQLASGQRQQVEARLFDEADGMASAQCNGGTQAPAAALADGRLAFATAKGVAVLDPLDSARWAMAPPQVVVEQLRVDEQAVALGAGVLSVASGRRIEVAVAGVSFARPQQLRYRSRLQGFDDSWVAHGGQRTLQYTNLAPGLYALEVEARHPGGRWVGLPQPLRLQVLPRWWQRPDLQLAAALLAVMLLLALARAHTRWRLRQALGLNQRLERLVQERTEALQVANLDLLASNQALLESQAAVQQSSRRAELVFNALNDALVGEVFDDRYRIDRLIGAGGFGTVYLATQLRLEMPVALKVFKPVSGHDRRRALKRFETEGAIACRVQHPSAVKVFDFAIYADCIAYLVMEYIDGVALEARMDALRGCSEETVLRLLLPVCDALAAAHAVGVVHRDVKPSNILICERRGRERIKLIDFGIAALAADASNDRLTASGTVVGTPRYMAPERHRGAAAEPRSDVYALALIGLELLAPPQLGWEPSIELLLASERVRNSPLRPLLQAALASDPRERPQAAQLATGWRELRRQLRAMPERPRGNPRLAAAAAELAPLRQPEETLELPV